MAERENTTSMEQLDEMLERGQVSDEDYDILRAALENRAQREASAPVADGLRLRKSWRNRQLGGVCAGMARAWGLEAWTVRALFLIAAFFSGGAALAVYLVLYAALPWDEREADEVYRFPLAFVAWVWGLYLALLAWSGHWMSGVMSIFSHLGTELPAATRFAWAVSRFLNGWAGLVVTSTLLLLLTLTFMMAPRRSATRTWIFRICVWGLLAVGIGLTLATYLPLYRMRTPVP